MSRKLVAYFSATGQTKKLAEFLARMTNGTLFEIKPLVPYTEDDLNWEDTESRSSVEMNNRHFRPKIESIDPHTENYDEIHLCFPIWFGLAPTIVNTFLDRYDFDGKKVILYATTDTTTSLGNAVIEELQWSAPKANFDEGAVFTKRMLDELIRLQNM